MIEEFPSEEKLARLAQEMIDQNKKQMALAWNKAVLGTDEKVETINMSADELRKWMYDSLAEQIDVLLREWEITANDGLIQKIKNEDDTSKRSGVEISYIRDCHSQVDSFVNVFDKNKNHSTRWDTMPVLMRENKFFNCVGATLLGHCLLKKAGIKNYLGNPAGHVVNIIQLSNGEWWYADFLNGKKDVRKIEPKMTRIANIPTFKLDDDYLEYQLIPILNPEDAPNLILGNLNAMAHEANDPSISDKTPEKKIAKDFMERFKHIFEKIDFGIMEQALYLNIRKLVFNAEIEKEKERIEKLHSQGEIES